MKESPLSIPEEVSRVDEHVKALERTAPSARDEGCESGNSPCIVRLSPGAAESEGRASSDCQIPGPWQWLPASQLCSSPSSYALQQYLAR